MTFKGNYKISLTIAGIQTYRRATSQHIWSSVIQVGCLITFFHLPDNLEDWITVVPWFAHVNTSRRVSVDILLTFSESRPLCYLFCYQMPFIPCFSLISMTSKFTVLFNYLPLCIKGKIYLWWGYSGATVGTTQVSHNVSAGI